MTITYQLIENQYL